MCVLISYLSSCTFVFVAKATEKQEFALCVIRNTKVSNLCFEIKGAFQPFPFS